MNDKYKEKEKFPCRCATFGGNNPESADVAHVRRETKLPLNHPWNGQSRRPKMSCFVLKQRCRQTTIHLNTEQKLCEPKYVPLSSIRQCTSAPLSSTIHGHKQGGNPGVLTCVLFFLTVFMQRCLVQEGNTED